MGRVTSEALEQAAQDAARSAYPYQRVGENYAFHERVKVTEGGSQYTVQRPVARSYGEAVLRGWDYYHPGGPIIDENGMVVGTRGPGWFHDGFHWVDDPEWVQSSLPPLAETLPKLQAMRPNATVAELMAALQLMGRQAMESSTARDADEE